MTALLYARTSYGHYLPYPVCYVHLVLPSEFPRTRARVGWVGKKRKPPVCSHFLEPKCHMHTCYIFAPLSYIKYYTSTTPTLEARDVIILNLSLAVAPTVFRPSYGTIAFRMLLQLL